mmetsp:Transcript_18464/g.25885  ORF Transcript_18464/g.25885 Transcript_18464/m.25885 type:complete len:383 (+) Transcript_18464:76-1224(+)
MSTVQSEIQTADPAFIKKTDDKTLNSMAKIETQYASPSPTSDLIQQSPFIISNTIPSNNVGLNSQSIQNLTISNPEEAIRTQIEYYFSDANLVNDKFLQSEFQKPEGEGQGYVKLELLATFPKMRRMQADVAKIRECLKQSETLVLNSDGTKVRRIVPFHFFIPEATVYVSFLPPNLCNQQQLQNLFGGFFGTIPNVDIPTSKDGRQDSRGIAFVQFATKEQATALVQQFKHQYHDLYKSGVRVKPYSKAPPVFTGQASSAPQAIPQQNPNYNNNNRSPASSPSNRVSIYESNPTFNYSSKGKTRKKRSDSNLESSWEPSSLSAEQRPKLNLKPRSASLSDTTIVAPSSPGGIAPIRQPRGPDNTKGFNFGSGRGKIVTPVS